MPQPLSRVAALACAALLLAGCAPTQGGPVEIPTPGVPPTSAPPLQPTPAETPTPAASAPWSVEPGDEGTPSAVPEEHLAAIRADLAKRGVAANDLAVTDARVVTWRDGSRGCPQPGVMYTQALEPGMRVVVRADGRLFDYRFGRGPNPRLCEKA